MYSVGRVKFFDHRPDRGFGFIVDPYDHSDIFFHWKRGGYFQFDGSDMPLEIQSQENLTTPIGDTELVYSYDTGPKGKRVIFWGHRENFNRVEDLIINRPLWRLVHREGSLKAENVFNINYTTIWEGRNIQELIAEYPVDVIPIIGSEEDDEETYFEEHITDGEWQKSSIDPRVPCYLREIQSKVLV